MAIVLKTIFLLIFFHSLLYPQRDNIKFEHLSADDGLSQNSVYCILQDRQGFMWFGTQFGLNRYDGYNFKVYYFDPKDSSGLSYGWIEDIKKDKHGDLWIATSDGLNRLQRNSGKIIHYKHDPDNSNSLGSNRIRCIHIDQSGIIWLGLYGGLNRLEIHRNDNTGQETFLFKHYIHNPIDNSSLSNNYVGTIMEDKEGNLWIGTREGLNKFEKNSGKFTRYIHIPEDSNSLSNDNVRSIYEDKRGTLWIGTTGPLYKFEKKKNRFINYNRFKPRNIAAIVEDSLGNLWIGGDKGEGLFRYDERKNQFVHFSFDSSDPYSLSKNSIKSLYVDRSGIIWIGTELGGINKWDHQKYKFEHLYHKPADRNSLSHNSVTSIYEDRFGKVWITTTGGGLNLFDPVTGHFKIYTYEPGNNQSLSSPRVWSICEDKFGTIWVGTSDGLNRFDRKTETFKRIYANPDNPEDPKHISHNFVYSVFEDKFSSLWIGTRGGGLSRYDRKKDQFFHYKHDPSDSNSLGSNRVFAMHEDKSGTLWVATLEGGLNKYDRSRDQFVRYLYDKSDPNIFGPSSINPITEDKCGNIWLGPLGGGLIKFEPQNEKFENFSLREGIPNFRAVGILEDELSNLWISTKNGLLKFNPFQSTFKRYDVEDGLQGNEFIGGAGHKGISGRFYFGGINGLTIFYPDSVKENPHIPPVVITSIHVLDQPLQQDLIFPSVNKLKLSYNQNDFAFKFAVLNYTNSFKNQYAYMLEGFHEDWVYCGTNRNINFTNIDPGEYVFRVKGSNNDGIWNEEGASIKIVITPPWWKTSWAYILYILLIGSIVYGSWRFQLNRERMKQQLKLEHLHAEKLEEVDRMKSRFFANISHEFRTPLTLIQGPIKQMLSGEFAGNIKEQYGMILRNSSRLLQLINQLLDLSKLESGRMSLKTRCENIIPVIKGIVASFASLAERREINFSFKSSVEFLEVYIDRDKFEKILNNLLSNTFKFTTEGGEVMVVMNIPLNPPSPERDGLRQKGDFKESPLKGGARRAGGVSRCVQITISNTGPGIPADMIDKIFDRFYQLDDSSERVSEFTREHEGTGIGLALVKELVELHHGEIQVTSIPNQKTTFTVKLLLGKEHLKSEEIISEERVDADRDTIKSEPAYQKLPPGADVTLPGVKTDILIDKSKPIILVVEDNQDMQHFLRISLKNLYRLILADDGEEGFHKATDKIPDLIISDVMMPKMDGFEFCRRVKIDERTSHIPVILLTARASKEDKIEGLETGADDYMPKPFDVEELNVRVKNLIEQRRKLRERFGDQSILDLKTLDLTSYDEKFMQRTMKVIEDHLDDSDLTGQLLGKEVGMSRTQLHRKIKALTDQSPHNFIRVLRLKRAAEMLKHHTGNVSEVAYSVGFKSLSHFARVFKEQFGLTPSQYSSGSS